MDEGFHSMLVTGKSAAGEHFAPVLNSDEVLNGGVLRDEKPLLSSLEYPYDPTSSTTGLPLTTYGFFAGDFQEKELVEGCLTDYYGGDWSLRTEEEEAVADGNHLKMPKLETSTEPFNFIPSSSDLVWSFSNQLPELQSLEQVHQEEKRFKPSFGDAMNPYALQSMFMKNFQLTANYFSPAPLQQVQATALPPTKKPSQTERARRRRITLSEKARSLQKVLPWDKKMDMATMYEETYKYIKFLQAQIAVLESMPLLTTTPPPPSSSTFCTSSGSELFPDLGKLNRQQLLEVAVNSPVVQTILYSKGCCIYSLEQLMMFKEIASKNLFLFNPSFFT